MEKYDLIVIGGGFAGTAAAISAARTGLDVLLVERSNCLGGAAANCLVNPFMPFSTKEKETGKTLSLSQGIFSEILTELQKFNVHGQGVYHKDRSFHEEYLKLVLTRMAQNAGVTLLFNTTFVEVKKKETNITSAVFVNKSGKFEVSADYYVDATGDADVAFSAGCPNHIGREDGLCQPMTLCFRMINVDVDKVFANRSEINRIYQEFQKKGCIQNPREDVLIFSVPMKGVVHFNSTRIVKLNPVDGFDVTKAEIEAREQVFELVNFMKEHIPGFENSDLMSTAIQTGVRESRMIDGLYTLTQEDLQSCTKFSDGIAACNYDIDIHNPEGSGTSHWYFPAGEYYTIPYRCLLPKNADNLIVAGRCISSTHEAQASYRIMPVVCCIGEAAGTAVGIAKKDCVLLSMVDTDKLRETLRKNGAFCG